MNYRSILMFNMNRVIKVGIIQYVGEWTALLMSVNLHTFNK